MHEKTHKRASENLQNTLYVNFGVYFLSKIRAIENEKAAPRMRWYVVRT